MKFKYFFRFFFYLIAINFFSNSIVISQNNIPVKVVVKNENGQWKLFRNGAPYFIKGAGGTAYMDKLVACGGNSIRTWSVDNAKEILDNAQAKGLTVMLGFWVGCERQGFDYDDEISVSRQLEQFKEIVIKYRNHPALLFWGVGNEMDLQYTNKKVWDAVEQMCKMIHELDPNHPTSTVTAGFHQEVMDEIIKRVPDLDIYGVNTYGDILNVPEKIKNSGWKGPYIITEWGPTGQWEVAKTEWNQPIEETSKQKAKVYLERYQKGVLADPERCIGSYVFLWGQKQETTSTWYGLFSKKGKESEAVDVMKYCWSGKWPENRAPQLDSFLLNNENAYQNIRLNQGNLYEAIVYARDPENEQITYLWNIYDENAERKTGGDAEGEPTSLPGCLKKNQGNKIIVKTPKKEGAYRLFVEVYDKNNHYAYANIPFYVNSLDPSQPQAELIKIKQYNFQNMKTDEEMLNLKMK